LCFGWFGAVFGTTRASKSRIRRVAVGTAGIVAYYILLTWGARLSYTSVHSLAPVWIANSVFVLLATVTSAARTVRAGRHV
jgi:hypothetical protein